MSEIAQYKLTNVLGTMYSEGNLVFTPDGSTLIAPVGNKITLYDLKSQKSRCLCFESTHNYYLLSISPDGGLLVALNQIGVAHFVNLSTNALTRTMRLGKSVGCIKFTPNGKLMAVGSDRKVQIYKVPSDESVGSERPEMVRIFKDLAGTVTSLDWSWDSTLLVVGSKDSPMANVYSLKKFHNFKNSCFTGHTEGLLGVFFEDWEYNIYTICRGGLICKWVCSADPEQWEPEGGDKEMKEEDEDIPKAKKARDDVNTPKELTKFLLDHKHNLLTHRLEDGKKSTKGRLTLTCADISDNRNFAVVGFDDGVFLLIGLPGGELIQQLRVTEHEVTTVAFAPKGEWIGIGAGKVGQLVVYDWQAEDYVLKEQGHLDTIQCLDFSSDGLWIVTGAHDGKVKLWKTRNCFSFHTFSGHTSIVTGVTFMQNNRAILSSSLDGTVRAWDVKRDRNFRTFTSPIPTQFCGVTVDSSSTYVASGSVDTFNVYVWHLTSGRFLLEITGHEAPISAICFSPKQGSSMLATVSWDKTLRVRDFIEKESNTQTVQLEAEGTALAFRPDGKEITVATLNGGLTFFDPDEQKSLGSINCSHHMAARRLDTDGLKVSKNLEDLSFNAVSYSADGTWVLAGGKSVNLCMYSSSHQVIAHKLTITKNRSLDGTTTTWTQKHTNEFGLIDMLEERGKGGDDTLKLPGSKATSTSRTYKPIVKVYATKFSPTGLMWAAASTEGVILYSMDPGGTFSPLNGSIGVNPQAVLEALDKKMYDFALLIAVHLNIATTTTMVLETTPYSYYESIARTMPFQEVKGCLKHLASILDESSHIELHMLFIKELLEVHSLDLMDDMEFMRPIMNAVKKAINARVRDNSEISEQNKYMLDVADVLQQQHELEEERLEQEKRESEMMNGVKIKMEVESDSDSDCWMG